MDNGETKDNFNNGFTRMPHYVLNKLLLFGLTKRQLITCLLITRLTYGCQKRWAKVKLYDLRTIGIGETHAGEVVKSLLLLKLIIHNSKTKEFRLNEDYLASEVTEKLSSQLEKLSELIGRQLRKKTYQKSSEKPTEIVMSNLPKQEDDGYQKSNFTPLPKQEVLRQQRSDFVTPKDILKTSKYSDKDRIANSYKKDNNKKVNPRTFVPNSNAEYEALRAWETLEPDKPDSFNFYLWAIAQDLPSEMFGIFTSEIKSDPNVVNRGAVFVSKVLKYLSSVRSKNP